MRRWLPLLMLGAVCTSPGVSPVLAGHGTGGPVLAIPAAYAKRLLDEGDRPIFIDLRPAAEFQKAHAPSPFQNSAGDTPRCRARVG